MAVVLVAAVFFPATTRVTQDLIEAAPSLYDAIVGEFGRRGGVSDLKIIVLGFYPPDEVLVNCQYRTDEAPDADLRFEVMHFGVEHGRWVFHPEDTRWVLNKVGFVLRRPDEVARKYANRILQAEEILERRRCARNGSHMFWAHGFLYCPHDGAALSEVVQRVSTKDSVFRRGAVWRKGISNH